MVSVFTWANNSLQPLQNIRSSLNTECPGHSCVQSTVETGISTSWYSKREHKPHSAGEMLSAANIWKLAGDGGRTEWLQAKAYVFLNVRPEPPMQQTICVFSSLEESQT
jgi:hypothetical protein